MGATNTYSVLRAITLDEITWEKSVNGDWLGAGSEPRTPSLEGLEVKGHS